MQVVLFENVDKLGMKGDVVNVAKGYYRNYLGPRGYAEEATESNLKRLKAKRTKLKAEAEKQTQEAQAFADRLAEAKVSFARKSPDGNKLFGSVHDHEIHAELVEQGFNIERRQIALSDPLKTVGTHNVRVRLVGHLETQITVVIEAEAPPESETTREEREAKKEAATEQPTAEAAAAEEGEPKQEAETEVAVASDEETVAKDDKETSR